MIDDIALNKVAIIRRWLARVREEFQDEIQRLDDITTQDSIVLNLLRACEASIDLAMHRIAVEKLGIPQSSRDAFQILFDQSVLTAETADSMKRMVGFRNIAVHSYQQLQIPILQAILLEHPGDFEKFIEEIARED